jgi:hypothetical protein
MMGRYVWRPLAVLLLLMLGSQAARGALEASLDRERVADGESVRLVIQARGQVSGAPSTEPLEKDFEVLGVSTGSQMNIVNGRVDATTTWTITLRPRRLGRLRVPPIAVAGERTPALDLEVVRADAVRPDGGADLFVETEVEPEAPYVQAMVVYTVRIFHAVRLTEGALPDPVPEGALVRRLGEDRQYSAQRNGRRYGVIERRYAVFPQASGELVLPGPVLDARVPDSRARPPSTFRDLLGRDPFGDLFASTRGVRVRGQARTLTVRPRPDEAVGGHWLPARDLRLTETWEPEGGEARVGEPLTRTLTVTAQGLMASQLPDLAPESVDGARAYPDRAREETRDGPKGVVGERVQRIAFVPTRPGHLVLPALRLHWWDTEADRERVAELPARSVEVLPAPISEGGAAGRGAEAPRAPLAVPRAGPDGGPAVTGSPPAPRWGGGVADPWPWVSAVLAFLWLLTLGLWWRARRPDARPEFAPGVGGEAAGPARRRFHAACRAGDARAARAALGDWGRAHWPHDPPRGPMELAARLDDPLARQALADLERALYGEGDSGWDGRELARRLQRLPEQGGEGAPSALPALYPRG